MNYTARKIDTDIYEISEPQFVESLEGAQIEIQPRVMTVSRTNLEAILADVQAQLAVCDLADNI